MFAMRDQTPIILEGNVWSVENGAIRMYRISFLLVVHSAINNRFRENVVGYTETRQTVGRTPTAFRTSTPLQGSVQRLWLGLR